MSWQEALQLTGMVLIPMAVMLWQMHRAATEWRERMMSRIEHVHECLEKRADALAEALHRQELRIVAIETRGKQVRRTDLMERGPE